MKRSGFIFLTLILFLGSVGATISNVHISPEYPNLDSNLIKVYAEISNESGINYAILHYQISDLPNIPFLSLFVGGYAIIYGNPKDNSIVSYQIEAVDNLGNKESAQEFSFTYDGSAPTISIIGENSTTIIINSTYDELGATAIDSVYGDLSSNVTISGSVDTNTLGEYIITYTVSDLAGNSATATRTVHVIEPITASVSISGGSPYSASGSGSDISNAIMNGTGTNTPESSNNPNENTDTSSKAGITGKSIIELIGENKGTSIIVGILAIGAIIGYYFIKKEIKRKLWGK